MSRPSTSSNSSDPFDREAVCIHGVARNHPFVGGNMRAAFMAGYVFLDINGWRLEGGESEAALTMLALAAGDLSEKDFADWLRKSCKPRASGSAPAFIL
jgi:death-on-curing protein